MKENQVSLYQSKDFTDLCKGPHVKSTKDISSEGFNLTRTAGAYWKGNEKIKIVESSPSDEDFINFAFLHFDS